MSNTDWIACFALGGRSPITEAAERLRLSTTCVESRAGMTDLQPSKPDESYLRMPKPRSDVEIARDKARMKRNYARKVGKV